MKTRTYSWQEFEKDVKDIKMLIGYNKYACLAPIAFGGLPLGTKLKNITGLPTRIIFASSYRDKKQNKQKVKVGDLKKLISPVLLIDDIADTG